MTLTNARPQTQTRPRRTALGLVFASLILGGTLTACGGSEADNTTCGELKGKSTDDAIALFEDAAKEEEDDEAVQQAVDTLKDFDDEQREAFADALKAACDGEDDDTKLKDVG